MSTAARKATLGARSTAASSKRSVAAAALALVAVCPVSAAHAAPGGDATIAAARLSVGPQSSGGAVATCPAGKRVVGGGVGTTAAEVESQLRVSGPVDETGLTANTGDGDVARHWYADVRNFDDQSAEHKVFALCSATSDATVEETSVFLESNAGSSAVATCPAGRRAVGGGIGTTAAVGTSLVRVSGPLDDTGLTANTSDGDVARHWYANFFNTASPRTYKVLALCSASSDATVVEETFGVPGGASTSAPVRCPAGRRALGGGLGTTADDVAAQLLVSGPLDESGATATTADGDVARHWYANFYNFVGASRTYKVFALCASDDTGGGSSTPGRTITGTSGHDRIVGTPGADVIRCGAGNDVVNGGGGDDVIDCGAGNDTISGGAGDDRISGASGKDRLSGDAGDDSLSGGSGADRASGGSGGDRISGGSGKDSLRGGAGGDRISGGSGNDRLSGNGGNDRLYGNGGRDRLSGAGGRDVLVGGAGRDRLAGGAGRDRERQ